MGYISMVIKNNEFMIDDLRIDSDEGDSEYQWNQYPLKIRESWLVLEMKVIFHLGYGSDHRRLGAVSFYYQDISRSLRTNTMVANIAR